MYRLFAFIAAATVAASTSLSAAERRDTVVPVQMAVRDSCIVAPTGATKAERVLDAKESAFGVALGTMGAKFVGDLVGAGLDALGTAIETASAEHGYVATGQTHYPFYTTRLAAAGRKTADLQQPPACLILFGQSGRGLVADAKSIPALTELHKQGSDKALGLQLMEDPTAEASLGDIGLATLPTIYIEVETWETQDGTVVRPVLVWYNQALKGAPAKPAPAELHITFATPSGTSSLGTSYAIVEIALPPIAPGTALGPQQLAGRGVVGIPARPTAGSPDSGVTALNLHYTALATANAELDQAATTLATAKRALARNKTAQTEEAVFVATEALTAKTAAQKAAVNAVSNLKSAKVGTTNVQARFVVIKDANAFGQAIGKAIKARADDAKTLAVEELTPKGPTPVWAATDTAYLQAGENVAAKQREVDTAVSGGDASALARLNGELVILKARANEAAVAASRPLPYPNLLP